MGFVRYTPEQLLRLKESPLVRKPDGLPHITQWMEVAPQPDSSARKQARPSLGRGDEQDGGEPTIQRPKFPTGQSARSGFTSPEDMVLGPPKMTFPSSARHQNQTKTESTDTAANGDESKHDRTSFGRFTRDPDSIRNRERNGLLSSRDSEQRDDEGWTSVKPRGSFGHEDGERWQRGPDRDRGDRERSRNVFQRNGDRESEGDSRRVGTSRNKFAEKTWIREEERPSNREQEGRGGARAGGWRDRERRDDREWTRGGRLESKADDVPEWMDEPAKEDAAKEESGPAKNVEDFEKWKAMQKAKRGVTEEKAEAVDTSTSVSTTESPADANAAGALAPDGGRMMFGKHHPMQKAEHSANGTVAETKAAAKVKASKFSSFFQQADEVPEPIPVASPPPGVVPVNDEDKVGFNRILQMLGNTTKTSPPPPGGLAFRPAPTMRTVLDVNDLDHRDRDMRRPHEFLEDGPNSIESSFQPTPPHQLQQQPPPQNLPPHHDQYPSPVQERGPFQHPRTDIAPTRNGTTNGRDGPFSAPEGRIDPNHAFLLNLMHSHPNGLARQGTLSPSDLNNSFVFPEHKLPKQQPMPQQRRTIPPGLYDDAAIAERHLQQLPHDIEVPDLGRKSSLRGGGHPAMGMFDDSAIKGLQRRTTGQNGMHHPPLPQPQQQQQQPPHGHQIGMHSLGGPQRQSEEMFLKSLAQMQPRPGLQEDHRLPPPVRVPPGFGPPPLGMSHLQGMQQQRQGPPGIAMAGMFPPVMAQNGGMAMPPRPPPPPQFLCGPNGLNGPGPMPPHFDPRMGGGPMGMPPGLKMQGLPGAAGIGRGGMMGMSPEEVMREVAMQQHQQHQQQQQQQQLLHRGVGGGRNGGYGL